MELLVLGGIARKTLDQLMRNPYRTIEVRSARNVIVTRKLKPGEKIFLTYETPQDITRGTEGIIAEVLKMEEMEQRIPWEESDEREITVCRIQLRLVGLGKVIEVSSEDNIMRVKVREMLPHEMAMG
ncbi:MAG: Uncharacterized protein XD43_1646 [Thermococcales archaeon 44_46]|uniref:DUF473 domain-containing protein n=1 Tax=Thermococcus sp. 101 C5 TaxID=2654197 RepID=UPI000748E171|nr:DUF473 domain-containing protein [Thermococcus sp. 101 C5]KUJ98687.1 MAG: Uncharacterized protein XD43_1646 [Thermococcales archaeon 44_46]MPW39015.1 DUF473 domain-containing protein [Thermococcus sp. 101 C5]HIH73213.1 DUF473 family protein [Thermococcaceae archaeon]